MLHSLPFDFSRRILTTPAGKVSVNSRGELNRERTENALRTVKRSKSAEQYTGAVLDKTAGQLYKIGGWYSMGIPLTTP